MRSVHQGLCDALIFKLHAVALGDVGVGGDKAATWHGATANLQRGVVGAHALKLVLHHRGFGSFDDGADGGRQIRGADFAIFTPLCVEVDDVFKSVQWLATDRVGYIQ